MNGKDMSSPEFIIKQLEEALEERQSADRRKTNDGVDPVTGADRRKVDRRKVTKLSDKR